ncbi:MAG: putative chemiosmotic efflux system protein [Deltaproteobacteria bacterium]|nr:putative chemiosmotic efflux system protein [Deltaproteobacteria bacterium]
MTFLTRTIRESVPLLVIVISSLLMMPCAAWSAERLELQPLIEEALQRNREILAMESRVAASRYRTSQAESLPDPMFMFGYQNEGLSTYNYGDSPDAKWMFEVSQMFPFAGKRGLRGKMAAADAESLRSFYEAQRLKVIARVTELFYDLFQVHKNLEVLGVRAEILSKIEEAALARYSAGMASQQDVIMAQAEKYMLLEKEEMLRQKIPSLEAMLSLSLGRESYMPLGVPAPPPVTMKYESGPDELIKQAYAKQNMLASAETKVSMAKREYFPDVTLNAGVETRGGEFGDMYRATSTINIPLYFKTKQEPAVREAEAGLQESKHELEATKLMIASAIRENYAMIKSAERLMDLYRNALILKATQDFDLSLSQYTSGRMEAGGVIAKLKALLDFDLSYWSQYSEREKAVARVEALTGKFTGGSASSASR